MTTKYDIGDVAFFIITKGKFALEQGEITHIEKNDKCAVTYRIGGHTRSESEIYDSIDEVAATFSNAIKSCNQEPFTN